MRYALISDVHANRPALEAVLEDMRSRDPIDAILHLGDLVGYAPWPNETVDLIRAEDISGVAGNYDSTTATDYKHCGCRYEDPRQEELSHISYAWTRKHVSPDTKQFLLSLPFRIDLRPLGGHISGPTVTLVHGNAILNTVYVTEDRPDMFLEKMAQTVGARSGDVICFGHTHKPWHRTVGGVQFVNAGSVGRPKDGDWRAGYVILDVVSSDDSTVITPEFICVEYDVNAAMRAICESDLPDEFAEYIRTGAKPAQ
ncbi:MAG: metallophosphoesterase family protein [Gemmatimonadaceae bacterium]